MSIVDCSTCGARINYFKFYLYERSYFRKCVGEEFALRGNSCRKVFYCPVVIQKLLWHQTKVFTYEMTGKTEIFCGIFRIFMKCLNKILLVEENVQAAGSGCVQRPQAVGICTTVMRKPHKPNTGVQWFLIFNGPGQYLWSLSFFRNCL